MEKCNHFSVEIKTYFIGVTIKHPVFVKFKVNKNLFILSINSTKITASPFFLINI